MTPAPPVEPAGPSRTGTPGGPGIPGAPGGPAEPGGAGPVRRVLDAIREGADTRGGIVATTGLDPGLVDSIVDHLVHTGRLARHRLATGCPDSGCGSCASGRSDGTAGCGAPSPATARGPVLLTLRGGRPT